MPEYPLLTGHFGEVDPRSVSSHIERGGFNALERARSEMTPEEVIEAVKASGLKGRGGAGYPCGLKWELAHKAEGQGRFVICNADEGEVGAFKDRYLIENDPFTLIEAIAIAAYAIEAKKSYIYLRAEYHFLLDKLTSAIHQTKELGLLEDIDIQVYEGAGAYICGEETALMNSIEGKRGEPRYRPPFPTTHGLRGNPTVINNVETLMNIPYIINHGGEAFSRIGTEESKGTKLFSVSGDVEKPGVYELVMGSRLSELVVDLAGAREIQMVQVGGGSGRIVPYSMIDTPLSYETVLGAGAVIVFNKRRDIIDIIYRTVEFLADESCGKCAPCRVGTEVMMEIMGRLIKGEGIESDIHALEELSEVMLNSSLCGLGQSAANVVLDSLRYFRNEYELRIQQSMFLRSLHGRGN